MQRFTPLLVSQKRDLAATRRSFIRALEHGPCPTEVSTDRAPAYPRVIEELIPVQNLRRVHYELGVDIDRRHRLTAIFVELARTN